MTSLRLIVWTIALTLLLQQRARTDDVADAAANQLAGLFMQSCVQFAGDRNALRAWARKNNLLELPAKLGDQFLHGVPGVVFDASNPIGKFVLISDDGGGCSSVADKASGPALVAALEDNMRRTGIALTLRSDAPDAQEPQLRQRDYAAFLAGRKWRIVAGTVRDQQGGRAMLTATPD